MKTSGLVTIGACIGVVVLFVGMCISANNSAIKYENAIKAQYEQMENVLGQYSLKVRETAKVPDMSIDGLKQVMRESLQARYGEQGSGAAVQWIKENYPGQVDSKLYAKIQQVIESGRDKFENSQTALIDRKQSYENALGTIPGGWLMHLMGFPKIDPNQYKIISSQHAKDAFASGVEQEINLR